jgi:diguanylate cyclase (GGDEF)-like protein
MTDPLTGIYNRLKFDEMLMKEISRSKRHKIPLSLVMFDIDHFKTINDTCGHHIGDAVLQQLTAHISKHVRKHDYFARWGGEEFMILLTHNALETAARFAEHLRAEVEALRIRGLQRITSSFGVAQLNDGDDIFSLTKRTDEALYKAKASGRNRVEKS